MFRRILLTVFLVLATACVIPTEVGDPEVAADAKPGEIAFRLAEPNESAIIVPVMIGESGPYDFVLDTGATLTCVGESLAGELKIPEARGVIGHGATVGKSGRMKVLEIESLTIGDTELMDVTACAIDLSQLKSFGLDVDGLLGLNVLKNFHVILDFERNVMRLDPIV